MNKILKFLSIATLIVAINYGQKIFAVDQNFENLVNAIKAGNKKSEENHVKRRKKEDEKSKCCAGPAKFNYRA